MDGYFANLEGPDLARALVEKESDWDKHLQSSSELGLMRAAALAYYGEDEKGNSSADIGATGSDGQLAVLKSNQFRATIETQLTIAMATPPSFLPVPVNSDHASAAQALIAKGLIDYYLDDGEVADVIEEAAESAVVLKSGWVSVPWDEHKGAVLKGEAVPVLDEETGEVRGVKEKREGDSDVRMHLPTDVIYDPALKTRDFPWVIVRRWENKYEVAAGVELEQPELAEEILALSPQLEQSDLWQRTVGRDDTDRIRILEFYHRPTAAVPKGKCAVVVGDSILLKSDENKYEEIPVYRVHRAGRLGTADSYTTSRDTLGLQKAVDVLTSIPYTNQRGLGGNIIWAMEGSGLRAEKLGEALTIIYGTRPEKPEVLQLLSTPAEIFNFREQLISEIANVQGLDNLSMGREERTLPGNAMALLDSRTQRAQSKLQKSIAKLTQNIANRLIRNLVQFGEGSRKVAMVVGKTKQPMLREFKPAELAAVDRIKMKPVSPLMRTPAGRLEIANQLLAGKGQNGAPLINAEQYLAITELGELDPLTEGPMAQLMRIRSENERLAAGEALESMGEVDPMTGMPSAAIATAMFTDNHVLDLQEHAVVLASVEARSNAQVAQNVLAHMQKHIELWRTSDPALLAALGIPPPPPPMMMVGPGGAPMPPGNGAPPQSGPPDAGSPPTQEAPGLPSMPTNPATGQAYSPTADTGAPQ